MIRELNSLSDNELNNLFDTDISIIEKIDAPYFFIEKVNGEPKVYKSNHEEINEIDAVLNSVYRNILNVSKSISETIKGNNYKIGLWYFPVEKPRFISYPKYKEKIMISDYSGDITESDINALIEHGLLNIPVIGNIHIDEKLISKLKSYINGDLSGLFLLYDIIKKQKPYSGTPLQNMEGVIFKTNKHPYQIIINDSKIIDKEASSKKIYRDVILKDFIYWYNKNLPYIEGDTLLKKITYLFSKYINATDITNRYKIERNDLIPPAYGYIGGLGLDIVPNTELQQRLMTDKIGREMYKIILNACRKPIKKGKNDLMNENDIASFNKIIKEIREAD